jgi:hypothetical protein
VVQLGTKGAAIVYARHGAIVAADIEGDTARDAMIRARRVVETHTN